MKLIRISRFHEALYLVANRVNGYYLITCDILEFYNEMLV